MTLTSTVDQIVGPSPEERDRFRASLYQVGGGHWNFSGPEPLEVWLAEQRMKAERIGRSTAGACDVGSGCNHARSGGPGVILAVATFQL